MLANPFSFLFHLRWPLDDLVSHHESTAPPVMDRARGLAGRIDPCLEPFEHEEVVAVHQPRIVHAAFQVGLALGDEWCADQSGGRWYQAKGFELVAALPHAMAATHHMNGQFLCRDIGAASL